MGKVHALKARWLMIGSHLGGLQHLDVFSGAITVIVLSNNHIVVGPSSRIGMQLLNVKTHNEKCYYSVHRHAILIPQIPVEREFIHSSPTQKQRCLSVRQKVYNNQLF